MPVPNTGIDPDLRLYLLSLEDRVAQLETLQGFAPAFLTTSAKLTAANAIASASLWGIATDLKTVVWSDGAHWYRTDTGAVIV